MGEPTLGLFYLISDLPAALSVRIVECRSGCWEWQGTRTEDGYGRAYWKRRRPLAHCLVYGLLVGVIPAGLVLDHECRNPPCCNPAHLEPVTDLINARRGRKARPWLPVVVPETNPRAALMAEPPGPGPWLPVVGWPDYMVSVMAEVWSRPRSTTRGGLLRQCTDEHGRPYVNLTRGGVQKVRRVHQLVAEAFLGPCPPGLEVRHLDGNAGNCALRNLKYGTHEENMQDQIRHGTAKRFATHCKRDHEFTPENTRIGRSGSRFCRQCQRERYVPVALRVPEISS